MSRSSSDSDGLVVSRARGSRIVGEFRCSGCGYGIVSRSVLPVCPMCRGKAWQESRWRPLTRRDTQ